MENNVYVFNSDTLEFVEYDTVEDFVNDVIDEEFLENLYNEVYGEVLLPILGSVGVGTILKEFSVIMDAADDEAASYISDIEYELEHDQISYSWNWVISYNRDLLEEEVTGEKTDIPRE